MKAILPSLLGAFLALFAISAWSDDDHDRAREARAAGEIVPLRDILTRAERDYPGDLLEVELEREDGLWVYEIKLLTAGGHILELEYNARTMELIEVEGGDD